MSTILDDQPSLAARGRTTSFEGRACSVAVALAQLVFRPASLTPGSRAMPGAIARARPNSAKSMPGGHYNWGGPFTPSGMGI